MASFEIHDTGDLRRVNKLFREQADGKQLAKELTKGLRGVLQPVAKEIRAAYKAAPSKGHLTSSPKRRAQPPLRTLLAKATRVEVRRSGKQAGARVRVDGRKMPSHMRSLPRYWEGAKPRWRAPVFGNRQVWAQYPPHPQFKAITHRHEPAARREVERIVAEVARKIQRGQR